MVEDENTNNIIAWTKEYGKNTFTIYDTKVFARDVLPKYFTRGNMQTFLRQLNKYSFVKFNKGQTDRLIMHHKNF